MKISAQRLLKIDRLFRLPYRLILFLASKRNDEISQASDRVVVIKLMGMGSLIRFASLCQQHLVDKDQITIVTFSHQQEVCKLFGFPHLYLIQSTSVWKFIRDCLRLFGELRREKPTVIIDFERCSFAVGTFSILLAWWSRCSSLSFSTKSLLKSNNITVYPANEISLEQIFLYGIDRMKKNIHQSVAALTITPLTKKILININASDYLLARRYPSELYANVIRQLHTADKNHQFYLTGSADEFDYVNKLIKILAGLPVYNQAGLWSLSQLVDELSNCNLFITGDSGPLHLAIHMGVPTLALWGPTQASHFGYQQSKNLVSLSLKLSCSPCFIHPGSTPALSCKGRIDCLTNLTPSLIVEESIRLLSQSVQERNINFPMKTNH